MLSMGAARPQRKKMTAAPLRARRGEVGHAPGPRTRVSLVINALKSSRGLKRPETREELIKHESRARSRRRARTVSHTPDSDQKMPRACVLTDTAESLADKTTWGVKPAPLSATAAGLKRELGLSRQRLIRILRGPRVLSALFQTAPCLNNALCYASPQSALLGVSSRNSR
jgi:hypothetical protein